MLKEEEKHKIISMSLTPNFLEEIDSIRKNIGFSGRSETIRAGIKALKEEQEERSKLRGEINASLTVVHVHAKNIGKIIHNYQNFIVSHLHNHLDKKCVDLFILKGEAKSIRGFIEALQKNKGVEQAKLTIVS